MQQIKISEAVSTALTATNQAIQQGIVLFVIVFHICLILSKMFILYSCLNVLFLGVVFVNTATCLPFIL